MGQEPAAEHLCAHRQQAGHEAVRLEEGADEGARAAKGGRPLDHPPLLQFQVGGRKNSLKHSKIAISKSID